MAESTVYGLVVGVLGNSGGGGGAGGKTPGLFSVANLSKCSARAGSVPGGRGGKKGKGR